MGQAKQRGSFEDRKAAAVAAQEKARQDRSELDRQRRLADMAKPTQPHRATRSMSTASRRATGSSLRMAIALSMLAAAPAPEGQP